MLGQIKKTEVVASGSLIEFKKRIDAFIHEHQAGFVNIEIQYSTCIDREAPLFTAMIIVRRTK